MATLATMAPEMPTAAEPSVSPSEAEGDPGEPVREGRAGARAWWGRVVRVTVWIVLLPVVAWAALRTAGWTVGVPWIQLVTFTPYVTAGALAVSAIVLALRWWRPALTGLVATGLLAVAVVPRTLPDGNPATDGPGLRVLAANLLKGRADTAALMALVRERRPNVLALQELTPDAVRRLDAAGLGSLLPHRVLLARNGVGGSGVYSRYPLREHAPAILIGGFGQSRAMVAVPGAPAVEVVSVHPCAPARPAMIPCWRAGLRALPAAGGPGAPLRILAGDFNATLDHGLLRNLLATGYRDAADVTGDGLATTWPKLPHDAPPVVLDHILADHRVAIRGFSVHLLPRTDHAAVFADLALPAR